MTVQMFLRCPHPLTDKTVVIGMENDNDFLYNCNGVNSLFVTSISELIGLSR